MVVDNQFPSYFRTLTRNGDRDGYEPLRWQERLFDRFCRNDIPTICDLPTGLGKTSVIHLWLLALMHQISHGRPRLPTRLVYVVDRRTVVDQATEIANSIKQNVKALGIDENWISVSTLRGQSADNREWSIDPARPAIVIGTVDMIGSRLLFSGYRSSYKRRPLEAGLLARDALLILDEAHLSRPFCSLAHSIEERNAGSLFVMHMSATSSVTSRDARPPQGVESLEPRSEFTLVDSDLVGTRDTNQIVRRYESVKRLAIHESVVDLHTKMVEIAADLARDHSRVVVFVRSPDAALKLATELRKHGTKKENSFAHSVELLTGTMRGWERDELLNKPIMRRFLNPTNRPEDGAAILVSTSAGEVGFDLNADHLVCDAAPLDSLIQRFGRVNRRGDNSAQLHLLIGKQKEADKKQGQETTANQVQDAARRTIDWLKEHLRKLEEVSGKAVYDASPKALAALPKSDATLAPTPTVVPLTDILLDAWSMTSITEPMPGRPPVGTWIRGIDADEPQTTFTWRSELDLDGFDRLELGDIEEWFDVHRILSHETLSIPTRKAAEWLVGRWDTLPDGLHEAVGNRSCVVDRAGLSKIKLKDLIDELRRKWTGSILDADLIIPAAFGGIETGEGLLDIVAPKAGKGEVDTGSAPNVLNTPDVADAREDRFRMIRIFGADEDTAVPLTGAAPNDSSGLVRFQINLPSDDDFGRQLVSLVAKREKPNFGTERQSLAKHTGLVCKQASKLAERLPLSQNEKAAFELAAAEHDYGKDREIWQRAVERKSDEEAVGKSGGSMRRVRGDYRHEFGSIREFLDSHEGKIDAEVFDLAMHIIAAHHGRSRPHFSRGAFDPAVPSKSPDMAAEVVRRFGRLQHKYGYWRLASLENLLRCADAMASTSEES